MQSNIWYRNERPAMLKTATCVQYVTINSIIVFFTFLILCGCSDSSKQTRKDNQADNDTLTTNDSTITPIEVSSLEEYIEAFPLVSEIPDPTFIFSHKIEKTDLEIYKKFTGFVINSCGYCGEDFWFYKPICKYETDSCFILFMLHIETTEYHNLESQEYLIKVFGKRDKRYNFNKLVIGNRNNDNTTGNFKFKNNNTDSLIIESADKEDELFVLYEKEYFHTKYNYIISSEMEIFSIDTILSDVPEIHNTWKSPANIDFESIAFNTKVNFSNYIYRNTNLGNVYIHTPTAVVPLLTPLAYKKLSDDSYLIIWHGIANDCYSRELRLAILKQGKGYDIRQVAYNDRRKTRIETNQDSIYFYLDDSKTPYAELYIENDRFYAGKQSFERLLSKGDKIRIGAEFTLDNFDRYDGEDISHFLEVYCKKLNFTIQDNMSFIGQYQTKNQYILFISENEEITSGSHSVSMGIKTYCFSKDKIENTNCADVFFYFSDGGDLSESQILKEDIIRVKNGMVDNDEYTSYDTLYLTRKGYLDASKIINTDGITIPSNITSHFNELTEKDKEHLLYLDTIPDDTLSVYIDSLVSNGANANYTIVCYPLGSINLSDSVNVLLWGINSPEYNLGYYTIEVALQYKGKLTYMGTISNEYTVDTESLMNLLKSLETKL